MRGGAWGVVLCALVALGSVSAAIAADQSTGAFVGMAEKGPLDTPVRIGTFEEFASIFGVEESGLALPWLTPSVAAHFANGGVELVVVRAA